MCKRYEKCKCYPLKDQYIVVFGYSKVVSSSACANHTLHANDGDNVFIEVNDCNVFERNTDITLVINDKKTVSVTNVCPKS